MKAKPNTGSKITVIYVCYLTAHGTQKQHAFIGEAMQEIRIFDDMVLPKGEDKIEKHIQMSLIISKTYDSFKDALKDAKVYCRDKNIHAASEKIPLLRDKGGNIITPGTFYIAKHEGGGSIRPGFAVCVDNVAAYSDGRRVEVSVGGYSLTKDEFDMLFDVPVKTVTVDGKDYEIVAAGTRLVSLRDVASEDVCILGQRGFAAKTNGYTGHYTA